MHDATGEYYDGLQITIRMVDGPFGEGETIEEVVIELLSVDLELDPFRFRKDIGDRLFQNGVENWVLKTTETEMNWGASSSSVLYDIAISFGAGVPASIVAALLTPMVRGLLRRDDIEAADFVSDGDLIERCRWLISARHKVDADELTFIRSEPRGDRLTAHFHHGDYEYWASSGRVAESSPELVGRRLAEPLKADSSDTG